MCVFGLIERSSLSSLLSAVNHQKKNETKKGHPRNNQVIVNDSEEAETQENMFAVIGYEKNRINDIDLCIQKQTK